MLSRLARMRSRERMIGVGQADWRTDGQPETLSSRVGYYTSNPTGPPSISRPATLATPSTLPPMLSNRRILIFTAPVYEDLELWYPKIRLEEEGAEVVVAGLDRETVRGKHGYPCTPDTTVDAVRAAEFDRLVIPGGLAP